MYKSSYPNIKILSQKSEKLLKNRKHNEYFSKHKNVLKSINEIIRTT